jgi:hypothetical protein
LNSTATGAACSDQGALHPNASTWTCSDGCNTCACNGGLITSTQLACGGSLPDAGSGVTDGGAAATDAGGDRATPNGDAGTDAGVCSQPPAGCARALNATPCQAGFICDPTQGCTPSDCFACDPKTGWVCSADCSGGVCVAGPDAGAASASCPSGQPRAGDPCIGPIACPYAGVCGPILWTCGASKSYWATTQQATCSGACPASEPKPGEPCMAGGKCSYTSACGSSDTVYCDGTGTAMRIDYGLCPQCPAQEPAPATTCSGTLSCKYVNACQGNDVASCAASMWTVLRGDCEK